MKAPLTPTRFHTSVRHYHRVRSDQPGAWNSWVGSEPYPKKKRRSLKKPLIAGAVLLLLLAIGVGVYFAY